MPLAVMSASTVVPYRVAMEYKLSPAWTTWVITPLSGMAGISDSIPPVGPAAGMISRCPMLKSVDALRPLASKMASTVVPYMAAMEERLSPLFTV